VEVEVEVEAVVTAQYFEHSLKERQRKLEWRFECEGMFELGDVSG
jgi:hypothetical protein